MIIFVLVTLLFDYVIIIIIIIFCSLSRDCSFRSVPHFYSHGSVESARARELYYSKKFNAVTVGFVVESETIPPSYYAYLWIRPWA